MPPWIRTLAQAAAREGSLTLNSEGELVVPTGITPSPLIENLDKNYLDGSLGSIEGLKQDKSTVKLRQNIEKAKLEVAAVELERGWLNLGGPKSDVGLPLNNKISVVRGGADTYQGSFRGGALTLDLKNNTVCSLQETKVSILLKGIECRQRQEKTDEIYAVVSILGPSNGLVASIRVPEEGTLSMGPDGMRILNLDTPLLSQGVLQDYYIWVSLVENDSGDEEVIAEKIADAFSSAVGKAGGALLGAPAEAVAESQTFKENIATGLAWIFGAILGMGDDPYNPGSAYIPWHEAKDRAIRPRISRNDDPKAIDDWTDFIEVSGTDDGGDTGFYAFYFKVFTEDVTVTRCASSK